MSCSVLIGLLERNGEGGSVSTKRNESGSAAADVLMIGRPSPHQNIIIFIAPPWVDISKSTFTEFAAGLTIPLPQKDIICSL